MNRTAAGVINDQAAVFSCGNE